MELTPVLSASWDEADSFTIAGYERHDGYQALRNALGRHPDEHPADATAATPASETDGTATKGGTA